MSYVEEHDSDFWSYGHFAVGGGNGVICYTQGLHGQVDGELGERRFVYHLDGGNSVPAFLAPVFSLGSICLGRCTAQGASVL